MTRNEFIRRKTKQPTKLTGILKLSVQAMKKEKLVMLREFRIGKTDKNSKFD